MLNSTSTETPPRRIRGKSRSKPGSRYKARTRWSAPRAKETKAPSLSAQPPSPPAAGSPIVDWACYLVEVLKWAIVPILHGSKRPAGSGWNKPRSAANPEGFITCRQDAAATWRGNDQLGIGAVLGPSGICSIDIDDPNRAREALASVGIDLDKLMASAVRLVGNPARAKLVYLTPPGADLGPKRFTVADPTNSTGKPITVFELRAGPVQDVLPPSAHPGTGKPYEWLNPPWRPDGIEELPRELLELWLDFDNKVPQLVGKTNDDESERRKIVHEFVEQSSHDPWSLVRDQIRRAITVEDVLTQMGATRKGQRSFFCPFHDESNPSFATWDSGEGYDLWVDFHGNAPVGRPSSSGYTMGDVIDLYQHLHKLSSPGAATTAMAKQLGIPLPDVEYQHTPRGTVWRKRTRDGISDQLLSNFNATIVEEVLSDDGAEQERNLRIAGDVGGEPLPLISVTAEQFAGLAWVTNQWGSRAIVRAGQSTRDHLRAATQILSPSPQVNQVFAHTGWRLVGNEWIFLHNSGAIGADGPRSDVRVDLQGTLQAVELPEPPSGVELVNVVRALLELEKVAPPLLTHPLLCAILRSVLCEVEPALYSIFLVGPTGAGKSSLIAVYQAAFGPRFRLDHLVAGWASTSNALERIAFQAKDIIATFDDFAPSGAAGDVRKIHGTAERILRGAGNRSGRARLRSDSSSRPTYYPRGLIVSTGEDVPKGHSLRARTLVLEVGPADIDFSELTKVQQLAEDGMYASAMAGYLKWLASRIDRLKRGQSLNSHRARNLFKVGMHHRRTPEIIASLFTAAEVFGEFAVEVGALSVIEASEWLDRTRRSLLACGSAQADHHRSADPVDMFLSFLASALDGGEAHVESANGGPPPDASSWGWRGQGSGRLYDIRPTGVLVGWVDDQDLYLNSEAAYGVVASIADSLGESLGISLTELTKRMFQRRLLKTHNKGRHKIKKQLAGAQRRVLHVSTSSVRG